MLARNAERHLKSPAAMHALFADIPTPSPTRSPFSRLSSLSMIWAMNSRAFRAGRRDMMSFLRERTRLGWQSGMAGRSELKKRARRQIERELNLIEHLQLAGISHRWDLVRFCREQNILVQVADRPQ